MAYQVIKFALLQFDNNWSQTMLVTGYSNFQYTSTAAGAHLSVVFESATGAMETYFFVVGSGESVYVLDQVVHVPATCRSHEDGRGIKCG
jgi:hypothetical protein